MAVLFTEVLRMETVPSWTDGGGGWGGGVGTQARRGLFGIWQSTLSNVNGWGRTKLKWA